MDLTRVLERAIGFLLAARDRRGWWRDFDTLAGESDEWVTAYTGLALALAGAPAHRAAWQLLRSRWRWSGGWGYSRPVPADADSTGWALRLGCAAGDGGSRRFRRGLALLARHVGPDGGVATFRTDGPIRRFTSLQRRISFDGWCGSHVCVSAAAAGLAELPAQAAIREFLGSRQASDGSWPSYWWCDRELATALAAEAFAAGPPSGRGRVAMAAEWALRDPAPEEGPTSAFRLSWRARLLALLPESGPAATALDLTLRKLAELQLADGSFPPSARLRIPPPDVVDPDSHRRWVIGGRGGGSILVDQRRVFTTATAVAALAITGGRSVR